VSTVDYHDIVLKRVLHGKVVSSRIAMFDGTRWRIPTGRFQRQVTPSDIASISTVSAVNNNIPCIQSKRSPVCDLANVWLRETSTFWDLWSGCAREVAI